MGTTYFNNIDSFPSSFPFNLKKKKKKSNYIDTEQDNLINRKIKKYIYYQNLRYKFVSEVLKYHLPKKIPSSSWLWRQGIILSQKHVSWATLSVRQLILSKGKKNNLTYKIHFDSNSWNFIELFFYSRVISAWYNSVQWHT